MDPKASSIAALADDLGFQQYNFTLNARDRLLDLVLSDSVFEVRRFENPFLTESAHHPTLVIQLFDNNKHPRPSRNFNNDVNNRKRIYNFNRANLNDLFVEPDPLMTSDMSIILVTR